MGTGQGFNPGGTGGLTPSSPQIAHDIQTVTVSSIVTTSTTPVTLTGATLTTKNFGQNARYNVFGDFSLENTNNNATITVQLLVNAITVKSFVFGLQNNNTSFNLEANALTAAIGSGIVISWEWFTSSGTATINNLNFWIDGTPVSSILP